MSRYWPASLASVIFLGLSSCAGAVNGACDSERVVFETAIGSIVIQVDQKRAPASAADFLKYVDQDLYKGAGFYRTVRSDNDNGTPKIDAIQGGLLEGTSGLPPVAHESTKMTGLRHVDGAISLARAAPGTGSAAAFFIAIGDQPALDHGATRNPDQQGFAVFGQVIRGLSVVRKIHAVPAAQLGGSEYTKGQMLNKPVMIRSARRLCG